MSGGIAAERMNQRTNTTARRRRWPATVAVTALLLSCSAGEQASRSEAIANGTPDDTYESVFLLVHHEEMSGGLCTATLIAPNLLLTARHCVSPGDGDERVLCGDSPLSTPYPAGAFFATNDAAPSSESPIFGAAEVRVPEDEVDTCGYDIALLILDRNVPRSVAVPAVPRIDREVAPGELYTAVGYGVDERGDPTGSRMQRSGLSVDCEPGTCGDGVEASEFRGETGICSGDSGGPAFDVDGKVVGVVSRGAPNCSLPVYGTVTAWQDFLTETAKEAAELGGYEPPRWVTTGSSEVPPEVVQGEGGAGGAEGSPVASAGSESTSPREGSLCDASRACGEGLVCYATSASADARCAKLCSETRECGEGQFCQMVEDRGVCTTPDRSLEESGGCSVSARSSGNSAALLWLVAIWGLLRRKLVPRADKTAAARAARA